MMSGELTVQIRKCLQQQHQQMKDNIAVEQYLLENMSRPLCHVFCLVNFQFSVVELRPRPAERRCRTLSRTRCSWQRS